MDAEDSKDGNQHNSSLLSPSPSYPDILPLLFSGLVRATSCLSVFSTRSLVGLIDPLFLLSAIESFPSFASRTKVDFYFSLPGCMCFVCGLLGNTLYPRLVSPHWLGISGVQTPYFVLFLPCLLLVSDSNHPAMDHPSY